MERNPPSQAIERAELTPADTLALTAAATSTANPADTLSRVVRVVSERLDASDCACLLLDHAAATNDLVYAAVASGTADRGRRLGERSLSHEVLASLDRAREWALNPTASRDRGSTPPVFRGPLTEQAAGRPGAVAGLIVPLVCGRRLFGVLWVGERRSHGSDRELGLARLAAALLAQAAAAVTREREQLEQARDQAREHAAQLDKLEATNAKLREVIEGHKRQLSIRAHDMRAPIGVIQGHLTVLERLVDDRLVEQSLAAIHRQGERLTTMVDAVLGGERRRAEGLRLEPVDLKPWLDARARDFGFLAHKNGVRLETRLGRGLGIRRVDTDKLEEIVGNLLDNAIKYSGRGGTVWLEADLASPLGASESGHGRSGFERRDSGALGPEPDRLCLRVSDSGPGLSDEVLESGFEMWFRDSSGSNRQLPGSGVGLTSVLELVELMGGTVEAANRPEGGAQLTVEVPAFADELAVDDTHPVPIQRHRVLVIDDDPDELTALAETLRLRFEVVTARNEQEARWLVQQAPVDCAVVDLDVPRMTGFGTANVLRRAPELRHLPVLFTADDDLAAISVRRRGGDLEDVIVMPFDPDELLAQVRSAIEASATRSALLRAGQLDPLTGLLSRRYAEPELERQLELARRTSAFLSVLLVDVDDLDGINQRFGTGVGDALLEQMGQTLRRIIRGGETTARWGGDELLCLLPGATSTTAKRVAERVADRLSECRAGGAQRTVSVGVATADVTDEVEASELVDRARFALNVARQAGAGRVAVWERRPLAPLPDVGTMADKCLLIVDDDRDVLHMLAHYFSRTTNLLVETAGSLDDAVRKAARTPPQVAILDLSLPDGTGFELLRRLRQDTDPSLPAIAYTGESDIATIDRTEEAGFNACLTKTAQLDHLADEVNRWLH